MIVEADQCESDRFEFLFKEGLHTHGVLNFERAHAKTSKGTDISAMDKMSWSFDKDKAELAYQTREYKALQKAWRRKWDIVKDEICGPNHYGCELLEKLDLGLSMPDEDDSGERSDDAASF